MSRRLRWAVATAGTLLVLALTSPAGATTSATPTPPASGGDADLSAVEPVAVEGTGNPEGAPELTEGRYFDIVREPETLWYAFDAGPGQQVAVTVVVRGRPDGPETDRSELRVALLDGQRQELTNVAAERFTGRIDTRAELVSDELLPLDVDGPLSFLTVTLASPQGANDLGDLGYQLEIAVAVSGDVAVPSEEPSEPAIDEGPADAAPTPTPRAPRPAADASGRYQVPVGLLGLAAGGALGFESGRKRRRR